jgi:hypothetical protein
LKEEEKMAPKKRVASSSDSDSGPDDRTPVKKVRLLLIYNILISHRKDFS